LSEIARGNAATWKWRKLLETADSLDQLHCYCYMNIHVRNVKLFHTCAGYSQYVQTLSTFSSSAILQRQDEKGLADKA